MSFCKCFHTGGAGQGILQKHTKEAKQAPFFTRSVQLGKKLIQTCRQRRDLVECKLTQLCESPGHYAWCIGSPQSSYSLHVVTGVAYHLPSTFSCSFDFETTLSPRLTVTEQNAVPLSPALSHDTSTVTLSSFW